VKTCGLNSTGSGCGRVAGIFEKTNGFIFRKSELVIPLDHLISWSVMVNLLNPLKNLEESVVCHAVG